MNIADWTPKPIVVTITVENILGIKVEHTMKLQAFTEDSAVFPITSVIGGEICDIDTDTEALRRGVDMVAEATKYGIMGAATQARKLIDIDNQRNK